MSEKPNEQASEGIAPLVTAKDVADRLAKKASESSEPKNGGVRENKTAPFDISKITPDQLSALKAMLNVTPDRVQARKGNSVHEIRAVESEDGGVLYVVGLENARRAMIKDPETGAVVEGNKMRVTLSNGETRDFEYQDFMALPRVKVEEQSSRVQKDIRYEGQVVHRETGRLVEKEVTLEEWFYTVKLPNGRTIELPSNVINA